jgi:hypothetical protein
MWRRIAALQGHQGLAWPLPATFASGSGTRASQIAQEIPLLGHLPAANISARSAAARVPYHQGYSLTGLQQVALETPHAGL